MMTVVLFTIAAICIHCMYRVFKVDILGIPDKPTEKVRNSPVKPKLKKKATPKPISPKLMNIDTQVILNGVRYRLTSSPAVADVWINGQPYQKL